MPRLFQRIHSGLSVGSGRGGGVGAEVEGAGAGGELDDGIGGMVGAEDVVQVGLAEVAVLDRGARVKGPVALAGRWNW